MVLAKKGLIITVTDKDRPRRGEMPSRISYAAYNTTNLVENDHLVNCSTPVRCVQFKAQLETENLDKI